jgi:hypothetical protein
LQNSSESIPAQCSGSATLRHAKSFIAHPRHCGTATVQWDSHDGISGERDALRGVH